MNYAAHYDMLIQRSRGRQSFRYSETHHVLPRCMGGGDEPANLVELTPEEHYVAHQLLVKIYPTHKRIARAAFLMAKRCSGNKAYGWLRRHHVEAMLGHKRSDESRAKQSAATRGRKRPPFTAEWRAKLSAARKGKPTTIGFKFSAESRAKMAAAKAGRPASTRALQAAAIATRARWQRYREQKAAK